MKIEKIEKYLEEVSEGTDFVFKVEEEKNKEFTLYMYGDNPCNDEYTNSKQYEFIMPDGSSFITDYKGFREVIDKYDYPKKQTKQTEPGRLLRQKVRKI